MLVRVNGANLINGSAPLAMDDAGDIVVARGVTGEVIIDAQRFGTSGRAADSAKLAPIAAG